MNYIFSFITYNFIGDFFINKSELIIDENKEKLNKILMYLKVILVLLFISSLELFNVINVITRIGIEFYIIWSILSVIAILNAFDYGIFSIKDLQIKNVYFDEEKY